MLTRPSTTTPLLALALSLALRGVVGADPEARREHPIDVAEVPSR